MVEEGPPIIPNLLLPEIPLLETVLNLRNENLTDRILEKVDLNISRVEQALRETNENSNIRFKKKDKVKDVLSLFFSSFC